MRNHDDLLMGTEDAHPLQEHRASRPAAWDHIVQWAVFFLAIPSSLDGLSWKNPMKIGMIWGKLDVKGWFLEV